MYVAHFAKLQHTYKSFYNGYKMWHIMFNIVDFIGELDCTALAYQTAGYIMQKC